MTIQEECGNSGRMDVPRYPSYLGYMEMTIPVNMEDWTVGYTIGLAGMERMPDPCVLDFGAWHYGYAKGRESREIIANIKVFS